MMPLSFESLSHGTIAFGFFNIESDMLLMDRYFFFATEFCDMVNRLADQHEPTAADFSWQIRVIENAADIGDLMGAIHGVRFSGFIGGVYQRYPFPLREGDFKQHPDGVSTQKEVAALIEKYSKARSVRVAAGQDGAKIAVGAYLFGRSEFHRLLDYVWLGGYPRWRDDVRPGYVRHMRDRVLSTTHPLFSNLVFSR
jgi:hypothetical protein